MATTMKKLDPYQSSQPSERLDAQSLFLRKPLPWGTTPSSLRLGESSRRPPEELKRDFAWPRGPWKTSGNEVAEAIVITDTVGQITMANGAALTFLYHTPGNLLGQSCDALRIGGLDCPHQALSQEQPLIEREILSPAGDHLLNIRVSSFADADGRVCGFAHVIRDVTSERALKDHLIEVERMSLSGLMVSSVAHDVATPLNIITNIAELLLLDSEPGSPITSNLKKVMTQARRVAEMTHQLLDFVSPRPAEFIVVDLVELTRETLDLIQCELRKANIRVSIESSLETAPVWGDRVQLQQVLLNIITNAIQAMKKDGLLMVRIAEDSCPLKHLRSVLLSIEDRGPGLSAQAMERMFDYFFTTKSAEGGTGLGLAICKQILDGHDATITAENIESGGVRFSIRLQVATACEARACTNSPQVS